MWEEVKAWFRNSMTIFWARAQMIGAAVLTVASAMDFSPLVAGGVPTRQQWFLYAVLFGQGMVTEIARRRSLPAG